MGRIFGVLALCGLVWGLGGASQAGAQDRDKVFVRHERDGRVVYTNVANVSERGVPLKTVDLPGLIKLDVASVPPERLPVVDERITEIREKTQRGQNCEAIRAASRVPLRIWVWEMHQRELSTAAGLFVLSLIVGFAWSGRVMRTVMPIPPFAGAVFLAYVAVTRAQEGEGDLHSGLRACAADLPESHPQDPAAVRQRLATAAEYQAEIDRVAAARQPFLNAAGARDLR